MTERRRLYKMKIQKIFVITCYPFRKNKMSFFERLSRHALISFFISASAKNLCANNCHTTKLRLVNRCMYTPCFYYFRRLWNSLLQEPCNCFLKYVAATKNLTSWVPQSCPWFDDRQTQCTKTFFTFLLTRSSRIIGAFGRKLHTCIFARYHYLVYVGIFTVSLNFRYRNRFVQAEWEMNNLTWRSRNLHNHNSVGILMSRKITRLPEVNVIDSSVVCETSVQS